MARLFVQMIVFWMGLDLAITRQRLQECKEVIAHDEARLHYWQLRLLELQRE